SGACEEKKPLLLAWLIALCSWPAGRVTQLSAVLPSALAAIAMVLAVCGFARSLFGPRAALPAALVALTTQGAFVHARLPLPDMLMTAFLTGSLWMLWEVHRGGGRPHWLGFYGLASLAF